MTFNIPWAWCFPINCELNSFFYIHQSQSISIKIIVSCTPEIDEKSEWFSWRFKLRLSYFSHLQRQAYDKRTNRGTPQLLHKKIQNWYPSCRMKPWSMLACAKTWISDDVAKFTHIMCDEANAWIIHTNNPHPDGATREAFKRIFQEKRSRWPLKIIIFRLLKMIIFRTHEWDIVNIIHLWKIQVALKSRLNFMKCLKSQGCFQNVPESPFFYNFAYVLCDHSWW